MMDGWHSESTDDGRKGGWRVVAMVCSVVELLLGRTVNSVV